MTSEYTPDEEQVRDQYTQEQPPQIGTVAEKRAEFDRFLAKVYADGMRSVADWIDGGTPRAYGFEHPCDPPGVRTDPSKKDRELMGIADATRDAASRIEEKAGRIERGER